MLVKFVKGYSFNKTSSVFPNRQKYLTKKPRGIKLLMSHNNTFTTLIEAKTGEKSPDNAKIKNKKAK